MKNLELFNIPRDNFPRFTILCGDEGSGRKTLALELARYLGCSLVTVGTTVDEIRQMISNANRATAKLMYLIPDADKLSPASKNAMLKVAEETPNNVYIVMTLLDIANTLGTIKSRAYVYDMEPYNFSELKEIAGKNGVKNANICLTPGDVLTLKELDEDAFIAYVRKVVDNIDVVSDANSFKIASMLSVKEGDGKYPLRLFFNAFTIEAFSRWQEDTRFLDWVAITSEVKQGLKTVGVNKQMLVDQWILKIRGTL